MEEEENLNRDAQMEEEQMVVSVANEILARIRQRRQQMLTNFYRRLQRRRVRSLLHSTQYMVPLFVGSASTQMNAEVVRRLIEDDSAITDQYISPKSLHFWHHWIHEVDLGDVSQYPELFRMDASSFCALCDQVAHLMETNPPHGLSPNRWIPPAKQVAIALNRYGSGSSLLQVGTVFGIARSTVLKYCLKFIEAVILKMGNLVAWPDNLELVKSGFERYRCFPNCCGAIDVTHFKIHFPANAAAPDYWDRSKDYSITMQALVSMEGRFLDVSVGVPGSNNNLNILRMSALYQKVQAGELFRGAPVKRGDFYFPEYILADGGYQDLPWAVLPFPGENLAQEKSKFNHWLRSCRMITERVFGNWKNKWRYFLDDIETEHVTQVSRAVFAFTCIHNFLLNRGSLVIQPIEGEAISSASRRHVRGRPPSSSAKALRLRNDLCMYLNSLE